MTVTEVTNAGFEQRLQREQLLTKANPVRYRQFVHENALRAMVGSARIMHEQMFALMFAADSPLCSIRVVPRSAGARGTT